MDKQIVLESEMDYYGFSLEQFKLEGKVIAKIILKKCVETLKNKLIEKLKDANASHSAIEKLIEYPWDDLCLEIFNSFEAQFKDFDELVETAFSLSEKLIYGSHEKCAKYKESDEEFLKNEIQELESWYMQNKYMLFAMETELESYEELEPIIKMEALLVEKLQKTLEIFQNDSNLSDRLIERIHNLNID